MATDRMIARKEGALGWMIFNNPERHNAVSGEMWEAIPGILRGFDDDPDIRVILLRGAGERAFVSGADISQFERSRATKEDAEASAALGNRGRESIGACRKPTIAMIRGYCLGGGLAVALHCDLRIAADDARFGVPAGKLGNGYGYSGSKLITDRIGAAYGKEMLFTARQFDAQEAWRIGLVNRVVPVAELERTVRSYADDIARNAPLTVAAAKLAFNAAEQDAGERDMAAVNAAVEACVNSEDIKEGRRAFMEKRPPVFRGV